MPRKYYCANCGIELKHTRRAVPGKGHIFDLIIPHECEGYAIATIEDEDKPTVLEILDKLKPVVFIKEKDDESIKRNIDPGDRRLDMDKSSPARNIREALNLPPED